MLYLGRVSGIGCHLLNLHLVAIDNATPFLNQLLRNPLSLEGDKAEVLRFVVLALVNRPDDLRNISKLTEVLSDLLLSQTGLRKLSNINLPRLDVRFFHSYGLVLTRSC